MSRSSYSDDYGDDFPGQLELYRANVARSIASKKGQARLRELREALNAMPVKALKAETFLRPSGEACALGAWAAKFAPDDVKPKMLEFDGNDDDTFDMLAPFGWPRLVVLDLVYQNDGDFYRYATLEGPKQFDHQYGWSCYDRRVALPETDEERYTRELAWVESNITVGAVKG